jgi:hypothetical protein
MARPMPKLFKPELEAYELMRAGRFAEALPFAEDAVAGQRVCVPVHGMLARILLHLGRAGEAEQVVTPSAAVRLYKSPSMRV